MFCLSNSREKWICNVSIFAFNQSRVYSYILTTPLISPATPWLCYIDSARPYNPSHPSSFSQWCYPSESLRNDARHSCYRRRTLSLFPQTKTVSNDLASHQQCQKVCACTAWWIPQVAWRKVKVKRHLLYMVSKVLVSPLAQGSALRVRSIGLCPNKKKPPPRESLPKRRLKIS